MAKETTPKTLVSTFIQDYCTAEPEFRTDLTYLHGAFDAWHSFKIGISHYRLTLLEFAQALEALGYNVSGDIAMLDETGCSRAFIYGLALNSHTS